MRVIVIASNNQIDFFYFFSFDSMDIFKVIFIDFLLVVVFLVIKKDEKPFFIPQGSKIHIFFLCYGYRILKGLL